MWRLTMRSVSAVWIGIDSGKAVVAINARMFAFRIARHQRRPLHFSGGLFRENTYENSRVPG